MTIHQDSSASTVQVLGMDCCGISSTWDEETAEKDNYTATTSWCSSFSSPSMAAISVGAPRTMESEEPIASSLSESSSKGTNNGSSVGKSGAVSPYAIVQPRRLSATIVKAEEDSRSKVAAPTLVSPELSVAGSEQEAPHPHRRVSRAGSLRRFDSAPIEHDATKVLTIPPPLRLEAWAEPAADSFKVRGPKYLRNSKKFPSDGSAFQLITVDLVQTKKPCMAGICSLPNERFQLALKREQETGHRELPDFVFCVNLIMPGDSLYNLVFYFGLDDIETIKTNKTPFGRVARRFFFGSSDQFRDETFKLIPRIVDGNFVVKKAVGTKPALLGTKVSQSYIRTERYFELIVDISSDAVAEKIVKLTLGYVSVFLVSHRFTMLRVSLFTTMNLTTLYYVTCLFVFQAKSVIVDMAFVLEGKREDELPEQLLGSVRLKNVDFKYKDGQRVCSK